MTANLRKQKTKSKRRGVLMRFCARPFTPLFCGVTLPLALCVPASAQTAPAGGAVAGQTPAVVPNTQPLKPNTILPTTLVDEKGNLLVVPQAVAVPGLSNAAPSVAASPGVGALETLRGNGGRTGYTLQHNAIVANSLSVYVGGKRLKLNEDYWLDAGSGGLYFAIPLRTSDSISVAYRYLEGEAAQAQTRSATGLQLNLGDTTHLNLLYGLNAHQENGTNLAMNGLRLDSLFGASGKSRYSGVAYLSDLRPSANTSASWRDLFNATGATKSALAPALPASSFGSGHALAQSLALQSGGLRVSADFQDVSKQFAGFADLKKGATGDKAALDQLTQMEKQKGLQRLGFGLGLSANHAGKPTTDGVTLEWDQIQDKTANDAKKHLPATALTGFGGAQSRDAKNPNTKTADGKMAEAVVPDSLPASRRQSLGLQSGGLGFNLTRRSTDSAFKRLGDLSDADKNTLALEIRRQFDPNAKVEQVTQADRDQIVREAGLSRQALTGRFQLGKTERAGVFTFGQFSLDAEASEEEKKKRKAEEEKGRKGEKETQGKDSSFTLHPSSFADALNPQPATGINRQTLGFTNTHLQFSLLSQTILSSFKRIGDLSDVEKAQFGKETGLKRDQMALQWQADKTTKFGFETLRIAGSKEAIATTLAKTTADIQDAQAKADAKARADAAANPTAAPTGTAEDKASKEAAAGKAIKDARKTAEAGTERQTIRLDLKGFKYSSTEARTDKAFARAADLALPDADKQQIEKERGFTRKDSTLHFDAIKGLTLDQYNYHAENTLDKLTHDISRQSIAYAPFKNLSLSYVADHDATFAPDPAEVSKNGLVPAGTVAGSANVANSSAPADPNAPDVNPNRKRTGTTHSLFALKGQLARGFGLDLQRDETKIEDKDKTKQITVAQTLNLGMPKDKKGFSLAYSDKRIDYQDKNYDKLDAKHDYTTEFNIHAKPTSTLTFQYGQKLIDRRLDNGDTLAENKLDGEVKTDSLELDWQAAKNFDIILSSSQTDAPDAPRLAADKLAVTQKLDAAEKQATDGVAQIESGKPFDPKANVKKPAVFAVPLLTDSSTVSIGVKSEPAKNISLAAKFDEIHEEGRNTKETTDFSIGNAKPIKIGVLQDVTVKAGYASLNDKSLLQNETMTGHAEWKMWKHEFLLDYGGFSKLEGLSLTETVARTYSFKTDPDPKRWFHGGYYYKVRTLADGKEKHIRRFTADALLAKSAHFTYTYGTLPEDDKGIVQPLETMNLALSHTLRPKTNLSVFYRLNNQEDKGIWTRGLGFSLDGQLGSKTKWNWEMGREASGYYGIYRDHAEHLRMGLDQQLNSDNFLSFSAEYRLHDGKDGDGNKQRDEVRATLDFSRKF